MTASMASLHGLLQHMATDVDACTRLCGAASVDRSHGDPQAALAHALASSFLGSKRSVAHRVLAWPGVQHMVRDSVDVPRAEDANEWRLCFPGPCEELAGRMLDALFRHVSALSSQAEPTIGHATPSSSSDSSIGVSGSAYGPTDRWFMARWCAAFVGAPGHQWWSFLCNVEWHRHHSLALDTLHSLLNGAYDEHDQAFFVRARTAVREALAASWPRGGPLASLGIRLRPSTVHDLARRVFSTCVAPEPGVVEGAQVWAQSGTSLSPRQTEHMRLFTRMLRVALTSPCDALDAPSTPSSPDSDGSLGSSLRSSASFAVSGGVGGVTQASDAAAVRRLGQRGLSLNRFHHLCLLAHHWTNQKAALLYRAKEVVQPQPFRSLPSNTETVAKSVFDAPTSPTYQPPQSPPQQQQSPQPIHAQPQAQRRESQPHQPQQQPKPHARHHPVSSSSPLPPSAVKDSSQPYPAASPSPAPSTAGDWNGVELTRRLHPLISQQAASYASFVVSSALQKMPSDLHPFAGAPRARQRLESMLEAHVVHCMGTIVHRLLRLAAADSADASPAPQRRKPGSRKPGASGKGYTQRLRVQARRREERVQRELLQVEQAQQAQAQAQRARDMVHVTTTWLMHQLGVEQEGEEDGVGGSGEGRVSVKHACGALAQRLLWQHEANHRALFQHFVAPMCQPLGLTMVDESLFTPDVTSFLPLEFVESQYKME